MSKDAYRTITLEGIDYSYRRTAALIVRLLQLQCVFDTYDCGTGIKVLIYYGTEKHRQIAEGLAQNFWDAMAEAVTKVEKHVQKQLG